MKRIAISCLCIILLAALLAGCGKEDTTVKELSAAQSAGVLRIGVTVCPPFAFREGEDWNGFDIALASDVCSKLGVKPEFVELEWGGKYDALSRGEVDCLWCGLTATMDLAQDVSYSQTYLVSKPVLITGKDTGALLSGSRVAAAADSAAMSAVHVCLPEMEALAVDSDREAAAAVLDGRASAAVVDALFAAAMQEDRLKVQRSAELGIEELTAVFHRDSDLIPAVNRALSELESTGQLQNLAERYDMTDHVIVG